MAEVMWMRDLLPSNRVTMAEILGVRQLLTSSRGDDGLDPVGEAITHLY